MRSYFQSAAMALCLVLPIAVSANAGETPSPDGAKVYFINLKDGDTVKSPVFIQFGLSGMGVAPAGIEQENTGHHHLFINDMLVEGEYDDVIPADEQHKHFGGGQTETTIDLPPGEHQLQLVLGDWSHIPHNPPVYSEVITVTVE